MEREVEVNGHSAAWQTTVGRPRNRGLLTDERM